MPSGQKSAEEYQNEMSGKAAVHRLPEERKNPAEAALRKLRHGAAPLGPKGFPGYCRSLRIQTENKITTAGTFGV